MAAFLPLLLVLQWDFCLQWTTEKPAKKSDLFLQVLWLLSFPSNALKCKYLMAVMYFVTVMSSIYFNFILLFHKKTQSTRGQGVHLKGQMSLLCKPRRGAQTRLLQLEWPCAQIHGAAQRLQRPIALSRGSPTAYGRGRTRADSRVSLAQKQAGCCVEPDV